MTKINFARLTDTRQIQGMIEALYKITGAPSSIVDKDGRLLSDTGAIDICTRFHRCHPDVRKHCMESDAFIEVRFPDTGTECPDCGCANGLRKAAMPVIINGEQVAVIYMRQFFLRDDKPGDHFFRMRARQFGFDEEGYLEAVGRVPVFTSERIADLMGYYRNMALVLADMELKNLQLAREAEERKQAEEALRQSQTTVCRILEAIPDQLHIIGRDFRILHSNWHGGYEYVSEEKRRLNPRCYEAFYGLDGPCENCHTLEVFRTGKPVMREKFNPKAGYVEIRAYPLFDAAGDVTMVIDHSRNTSERRLAEEALKESEQRLHATIQGSPIPILVVGTDRKVIYWNRALEQLTGTRAEDLIGTDQAWTAFYNEERPLLANLLAEGNTCQIPFLYPGKYRRTELLDEAFEGTDFFPDCRGEGRWLHFTAAVLRDTKGNLIGAMETIEDVTEREVAEKKWRSLYNNLPGGSFTVNKQYIIEDVNDVLCAITGFTRKELVGQKCGIICPNGPHLCPIFDAGRESIDNDETSVKAKDDRLVPIIKSARRIPAGGKEIIVENFQDITDRKQLEEQLRHAQKMEAVGQLAGGVAHDFNNILTAIVGYANLMQLKIGEDDVIMKYAGQIISSVERASSLTSGLLAFSRRHIVDLKLVRVNEIIEKAENLLSRLLPEDIELAIITGDDSVVRADSMQLEQVLMNLVTNARDAMPGGGRLIIGAESVHLSEEFVRIHGYGKPGAYVRISVSDTGTGIDMQSRERIFEPFYTTKEVGKGTGLGLSIVYGIIRQHNGHIKVNSQPGEGTTFRIYLPAIDRNADKTERLEAAAPPRGSETILLAEDDPLVRDMTKSLLQEFGYKVVEAEDGADAVEKFGANDDGIKLLILDVIMPKKNGKEVFDEIKKTRPDMEALFMSGYTDDILSGRGIVEEKLNFMSKPLAQSVFLQKVREILDKKTDEGFAPRNSCFPTSKGHGDSAGMLAIEAPYSGIP